MSNTVCGIQLAKSTTDRPDVSGSERGIAWIWSRKLGIMHVMQCIDDSW